MATKCRTKRKRSERSACSAAGRRLQACIKHHGSRKTSKRRTGDRKRKTSRRR